MADLSRVKEQMEVIGADGVHVGTVDRVEGDRIKLTRADSGTHGHHHFVSGGLVATVEGDKVRLSANGDVAVLFEEEADGSDTLNDSGEGTSTWKKVAIGAAAVAAAGAAGAVIYNKVKGSAEKEEADTTA